jgi:hypothetical protein
MKKMKINSSTPITRHHINQEEIKYMSCSLGEWEIQVYSMQERFQIQTPSKRTLKNLQWREAI